MKTSVIKHAGKGSQMDLLPSRKALLRLTGGDPARRTVGDYAKAAPNVVQSGPSIVVKSRE